MTEPESIMRPIPLKDTELAVSKSSDIYGQLKAKEPTLIMVDADLFELYINLHRTVEQASSTAPNKVWWACDAINQRLHQRQAPASK